MRLILSNLFIVVLFLLSRQSNAEPPERGEVALRLAADRVQPAGWPIIAEVTLRNVGKASINWWCGGPDIYPGAEHFLVQVRYGADSNWNDIVSTNGQYVEGSGTSRELKLDESITVPLAVPIKRYEGIHVRVLSRNWHVNEPAEIYVEVLSNSDSLDRLRTRVIEAALTQKPPFWQHLAERYPDQTVLDALLKAVTIDNVPIVSGAARVLARQKTLPKESGKDFAALVQRWLPGSPHPEWGGLRENVVEAALKTESEESRVAVLELLESTTDPTSRWIAVNALRQSPGDEDWLRRAHAAITNVQNKLPKDREVRRQTELALKWIDSRLNDRIQASGAENVSTHNQN